MGYRHKDLIENGAPELPEGYYYRVEIYRVQKRQAWVEVTIRKKNRFFLHDNIAKDHRTYRLDNSTIVYDGQVKRMTPEEMVVFICKGAYQKFRKYHADDSVYSKLVRLAGDYKE